MLLNAQLDTRTNLYRIYVIASDDALDVFMLSSHAVTDATSLIELHSCLAYMCDCVVRGVAPALEEQRFPSPVDAAVSRSLGALPDPIGAPPVYSGEFAEIPIPAASDDGPVSHRLERIVIDGQDMQRISAACHARGASVHSALLAAFALAIRDVAESGPRQILMRSSVDMRRRLEPHVSPELIFTAITGHITPISDLDQPLFDIAKVAFDDIHEGVANGHIFRDYVNYPKVFGSTQQPPVALNISDMQTVRSPLAHGKAESHWVRVCVGLDEAISQRLGFSLRRHAGSEHRVCREVRGSRDHASHFRRCRESAGFRLRATRADHARSVHDGLGTGSLIPELGDVSD